MIVTIKDFRKAGICPQAKGVFFERHGLCWRSFVKNGIHIDELRATGDQGAAIDRLEQVVLQRTNGETDGR